MKDSSVSDFFDYGVHEPSHTLYWDDGEDGINDLFAERAIKGLHVLRDAPTLTVILLSRGGDLYCAQAVYDAIRAHNGYVRIKALGPVMSAAAVILQAADWRVMGKHSLMMIHYGYETLIGEPTVSARRWMERAKESGDWMAEVFHERIAARDSSMTLRRVKKLLEHDTYYSAQEAIDIGLADSIGA